MGRKVAERYSLDTPAGAGPLGRSWRGLATSPSGFQRPVLVTALASELAASDAFVETLMAQGSALAQRPHPHVEGILDIVRDGAEVYLVLEATDGPTLLEYAEAFHAKGEPVPWGQLLSITVDLLYALHALHERPQPLAHGGLDTASVRLDRSGVPVLTRFGIAPAAVAAGVGVEALCVQTPHGVATPTADVFAVGLLLYTVLAGASETSLLPDDLRARLMAGRPVDLEPIREDVPRVVLGMVDRAFQSEPSRRFDSALAMARALELILRSRPEIADAPALARQLDELIPRQRAKPKLQGLRSTETDQLDLAELQRLSIPDE